MNAVQKYNEQQLTADATVFHSTLIDARWKDVVKLEAIFRSQV